MATENNIRKSIDETRELISLKEKEADALLKSAATFEKTVATQEAWLQTKKCNQALKAKKNACLNDLAKVEADNKAKRALAKANREAAKNIIEVVIPNLQKDIEVYNAQLNTVVESSAQASIELSKLGLDQSAIQKREELIGQAQAEAVLATAQNEMSLREKTVATELDTKKKQGLIFAVVGVIILLIGGFFLVKKLRKKQ